MISEDGVVVGFELAAALAGPLRRLIEGEFRRNGARVPAHLVALLDELDAVRRGFTAAGCAEPVARLRPVEGVSVKEAAVRLDCSEQNVRKRLARGSLSGWKVDGVWQIELEESA